MTSDDDDDDDDHFLIRFFSTRYTDDDCDAFAGLSSTIDQNMPIKTPMCNTHHINGIVSCVFSLLRGERSRMRTWPKYLGSKSQPAPPAISTISNQLPPPGARASDMYYVRYTQ